MDIPQNFKEAGFVFRELTECQKKHPKYLLAKEILEKNEIVIIYEEIMDKKIKAIEKSSKKVGKELKSLEKLDKKRDPACEAGKKMMMKKKK